MQAAYDQWWESGSPLPCSQFLANQINLASMLEQIDAKSIHTCSTQCQKIECVQRKKISELERQLAEERAASAPKPPRKSALARWTRVWAGFGKGKGW